MDCVAEDIAEALQNILLSKSLKDSNKQNLEGLVAKFYEMGRVNQLTQESAIEPNLVNEDNTLFSYPLNYSQFQTPLTVSNEDLNASNLKDTYELIKKTDNVPVSDKVQDIHKKVVSTIIDAALSRITDIKLLLQETATQQYGFVAKNIVTLVQGKTVNTLQTQSKQEIFVHELLHVATKDGLQDPVLRSNVLAIREVVRENTDYTIFLDKDSSGNIIYYTNQQEEIDAAKALYDYYINGNADPNLSEVDAQTALDVTLMEFMAAGLTNPKMISALDVANLKVKATDKFKFLKNIKGDSLIGKLINTLYSIIEKVFGNLEKAPKGSSAFEQLFNTVVAMQEIQNRNKPSMYEEIFSKPLEKVDVKINDTIDSILDKAKKKKTQIESLLNKQSQAINDISPTSSLGKELITKARTSVYRDLTLQGFDTFTITTKVDAIQTVEQARNVLKNKGSFHLDSEGLPANVINTLMGSSSLSAGWHKLINSFKANVDRKREVTKRAVISYVNTVFGDLTTEESKSLTINVLATDLSTAVEYFGSDKVFEAVTDNNKLNALINEIKAKIDTNVADPAIKKEMIEQADGLAYMMINSVAINSNQQSNAIGIANGYMFKDRKNNFENRVKNSVKNKEELTKDLDALATLYAIRYIPFSNRNTFNNIINRNKKAVIEMLDMYKGFKERSLNTLFASTPLLMRKGFYSTVYDSSMEFTKAPIERHKEMVRDGWELIQKVDSNVLENMSQGALQTIGIYKKRKQVSSELVSGIFGLVHNQSKGTTLEDLYALRNMGFDGGELLKFKQDFTDKYTKATLNSLKGGVKLKEKNMPVPIYNEKGFITDYRYLMQETNQSQLLNKNYDIAEVFGAMEAALVFKKSSKEVNTEALRFAIEDYDQNYSTEESKFIWINGNALTEEGLNNPFYEQFRLLPEDIRKEIKNKWGEKGLPLRKGMVRMILGGDKYTLAASTIVELFQRKYPNFPTKRLVSFTEALWQEVVTTAKIGIVIKTPAVFVFNIVSNIMLGLARGVTPTNIITDYIEGTRFLREYEKLEKERIIIEKRLFGKEDPDLRRKLNVLTSKINDSPIHEMIKRGLFQTIAEDVNTSTYGYLDTAQENISKTIASVAGDKTSNALSWIGSQVFMTSNSAIFKTFNKATQYSDFLARYALIKMELKKNNKLPANKRLTLDEIYQDAVDAHINYDLKDHQMLEYANSMGIVMFTKFFLGIQHVIAKTLKRNAARSALVLSSQYYFGNIADIFDENIIAKDLGLSKFYLDPTYHVDKALTPYGWEFFKDLFDVISPD